MSERILIDTDILIDISRSIPNAIERLTLEEEIYELCISVVTEMELITGCRNKIELEKLQKFLKRFKILQLTEKISLKASELMITYRLSHTLAMPDALIGATAIIENIPLLTKNQKDYRFILEIILLPYP